MLIIETVKTISCPIKLNRKQLEQEAEASEAFSLTAVLFVLLLSACNNCICIPLVANVPVSDQTLLPTEQVRKSCGFFVL